MISYPAAELRQGEELGRFNMGSTVIVLLPANSTTWDEALHAELSVRVGERIGVIADA
jgi:phosphatidylserine decarboxylase